MTKFIDLSREIYHRMPRLPNHPSIIITAFSTHEEVREADGYKFSSATMSLALGDHAGTHVDAPFISMHAQELRASTSYRSRISFSMQSAWTYRTSRSSPTSRSKIWKRPRPRRAWRSRRTTWCFCTWISIAVAMERKDISLISPA